MGKRTLVYNQHDRVGEWVCGQLNSEWFPGRGVTLGLEDESGELLAGIIYENFNGVNCFVHIAAVPGKVWGTREFLFAGFHYVFNDLNCLRITGMVNSDNRASVDLVSRLGLELEATLFQANYPNHILVYRMFRHNCKWIAQEADHGIEQSA